MVGTAPTLEAVSVTYTQEYARNWLCLHIYELGEYCGVRAKMLPGQIISLCNMILGEYGYLKVTEVMLFIHDFKMAKIRDRKGDVIGFYGSADPAIVSKALAEWERHRVGELQLYRRSQRSVEDVVAEYRHKLKEYCWWVIYTLRHDCDAEYLVEMYCGDYWSYIDRETAAYRRKVQASWDANYKMPWR